MKRPSRSRPAPASVRVAEFKANLSACLRRVQRGEVLTICDRDRPIARVTGYSTSPGSLTVRRAGGSLQEVPLPAARGRAPKATTLQVLLKDRRGGR